LERRYRALLRLLLPLALRGQRAEELLAVLLDQAAPTRRWPSALEIADLCGYAVRARARLGASRSRLPVWADGMGWAGAVSTLALAAVGAVVVARWAGALIGLTPASGALLVTGTGPLSVAGAAAAALWPAVFVAAIARRPALARVLVVLAVTGSAAALAADGAAGRGRPALDLCGGLAGLGLTAALALFRSRADGPTPLGRLPRRTWIALFGLIAAVVAMATAESSLGAPGPWLSAGPAVGLRTSLLTGLLVCAWLLASLAALLRRSPRLLTTVAVLSVSPLLGAAGYIVNSSSAHARPIEDLLAARAPLVAAGLAVLLVVVGRAGVMAQRTAGA
jgi:hypothetical protein